MRRWTRSLNVCPPGSGSAPMSTRRFAPRASSALVALVGRIAVIGMAGTGRCRQGYRGRDMPHWIALAVTVIVGWLVLAVGGGWLVGRGLALFEREGRSTLTNAGPPPTTSAERRRKSAPIISLVEGDELHAMRSTDSPPRCTGCARSSARCSRSASGYVTSTWRRSDASRTPLKAAASGQAQAAQGSRHESSRDLTDQARHLADRERAVGEREAALAAAQERIAARELEVTRERDALAALRARLEGERQTPRRGVGPAG